MEGKGNKQKVQGRKKLSLKKLAKRVLIILFCIVFMVFIFLLFFGWILSYTCEIAQHNMKGATGNEVWLHPDGHQEAVYDSSGSLVTDDENMGSYNYYHPYEQPLRHFWYDTLPWILWGNTEEDSTTPSERFSAWRKDVKLGAKTAFKLTFSKENRLTEE